MWLLANDTANTARLAMYGGLQVLVVSSVVHRIDVAKTLSIPLRS